MKSHGGLINFNNFITTIIRNSGVKLQHQKHPNYFTHVKNNNSLFCILVTQYHIISYAIMVQTP